ncbi:MAG: hypothetical protein HY542_01085, partial [Deltaproteobacteria bacterium]|nr:hypothetical protein [Deltaproteobacteria bacterium]
MNNFLNRRVNSWCLLGLGLLLDLLVMLPKLGETVRDADGYLKDARALVTFGTFGNPPAYSNMPGYPLILAGFLKVLPENYLLLSNLLFFAASSLIFIRLLEEMGVRLRVWSGGLFLFLWFLNPFFMFLRSLTLSENVFIPCLMLATLCFVRYLKGQPAKNLCF